MSWGNGVLWCLWQLNKEALNATVFCSWSGELWKELGGARGHLRLHISVLCLLKTPGAGGILKPGQNFPPHGQTTDHRTVNHPHVKCDFPVQQDQSTTRAKVQPHYFGRAVVLKFQDPSMTTWFGCAIVLESLGPQHDGTTSENITVVLWSSDTGPPNLLSSGKIFPRRTFVSHRKPRNWSWKTKTTRTELTQVVSRWRCISLTPAIWWRCTGSSSVETWMNSCPAQIQREMRGLSGRHNYDFQSCRKNSDVNSKYEFPQQHWWILWGAPSNLEFHKTTFSIWDLFSNRTGVERGEFIWKKTTIDQQRHALQK